MRIGSTTLSLIPRRTLNRTTRAFQASLERLSSGSRINSAKDDIAGLSASIGLEAQIRGTTQAIRNANDGNSMLAVAESAMDELTNILQSMRELAVQAANGILTSDQRASINNQVCSLLNEFDRIVEETTFNGNGLLEGDAKLRLQIGPRVDDHLELEFNSLAKERAFQKTVGTGSFSSPLSTVFAERPSIEDAKDLNGDGRVDLLINTDSETTILLGNGDGTFRPFATMANIGYSPIAGDVNGDGTVDIIAGDSSDRLKIYLGNGDGTFKPPQFQGTIDNPNGFGLKNFDLVDFDKDGNVDISGGASDTGNIIIFLGNGDGTFRNHSSVTIGAATPMGFRFGDLNHDGNEDLAATNVSDHKVYIALGNGDGTFQATVSYDIASSVGLTDMADLADLNRDGHLDVITSATMSSTLYVFLGAGDGTLQPCNEITDNTLGQSPQVLDINGDNILDIATNRETGYQINLFLGNGDGTFLRSAVSFAGDQIYSLKAADLNNDGIADLITGSDLDKSLNRLIANTRRTTALADLNLTDQTKATAALAIIDSALSTVTQHRADLGNSQTRLEAVIDELHNNRENMIKTYGEIMDADIAAETAELVRNQILQKAGIAMLAQANLIQANVLELLH